MVDAKTLRYVNKMKANRALTHKVMMFLPIFAIAVALAVFWWLKLTGITMTSEASCGFIEHTHTAECFTADYSCSLDEHTHTPSCYSDLDADLETYETWEATFSHLSAGLAPADKTVDLQKLSLVTRKVHLISSRIRTEHVTDTPATVSGTETLTAIGPQCLFPSASDMQASVRHP